MQKLAPQIRLQHDGKLTMAVGKSRMETNWKNQDMTWSALVSKLSETRRTGETMAEYKSSPKAKQDDIKDIGGFVGGTLKGGRRTTATVAWRCLISLDADFATPDFWPTAELVMGGTAMACYSTHKHTPAQPRLRLLIPLSRPVTPDEYEAIARRVASDIGIDWFDDTTYEPARLMYWPSTSNDAEYYFNYIDGPWLDVEATLATYEDWTDPSYWPESSRVKTERRKVMEKAGDPLTKPGVIGAFCRAHGIDDVINTYLSDVYTSCDMDGRYTYVTGSTVGGLVAYEDKFVYSHHGTDPAGGQLLNAFDLVRIHKYGELDADAPEGTAHNRLPSYLAMCEFAANDPHVRIEMAADRKAEASQDFAKPAAETKPDAWKADLAMAGTGNNRYIASSIENIVLIMENDERLSGRLRHNEFAHRPEVVGKLPWKRHAAGGWSDADDAHLRLFLEKHYGISGKEKIFDATNVVFQRHAYHPVREYLESLEWDGKERVETLFADWLGAEDSAWVRAVTRKTLAAAVARVMEPGVKFDYMLVLVGPQGIGKSSLMMKLAGKWFSDSLVTVEGKEAFEALQGSWILELGELTATKRSEVEAIKLFLSKQVDKFREAYGRRTAEFPRQCIFIGTTNDDTFLKDRTGNRRYWPIKIGDSSQPRKGNWSKITKDEIDQIWAEAYFNWMMGESLYLSDKDMASEAQRQQAEFTEDNIKIGIIAEYLEKNITENWYDLPLAERKNYLYGVDDGLAKEAAVQRRKVCIAEIYEECLGRNYAFSKPQEIREIADIMRNMSGWKKGTTQRFGRGYGTQKAYLREDS